MKVTRFLIAMSMCVIIHATFAGTTWWWATIDNVRWRASTFYYDYNRVRIAGYEDGDMGGVYPGVQNYGASIHVPGSISGDPVTVIDDYTFYKCRKIKQITLPNTITLIGFKSFWYCTGLELIAIPSDVQKIENYAFCGCSNLKTIVFNGNAPTIGTGAFNVVNSVCTAYVLRSSTGWGVNIPGTWNGIKIDYLKVVKFNANGGNVSAADRNLVPGDAVGSLPTPTRTGCTFNGWYSAASGGTKISASTIVSADTTYYAHWTANHYTITFDANGGAGGTDKNLAYDTTLGTLPEATHNSFDFGGWWTTTSGGMQVTASTKVTGDVTYYAHWIDPIPDLATTASDTTVAKTLSGVTDERLSTKVATRQSYADFRQWVDSRSLSHKAVRAAPNAWLSYALDAPAMMAKPEPLASEDVVIESIAPLSAADGAFDLAVSIGGAEIGEGARLAEAFGIEGAAELNESVFSSEGLSVSLERTADGKAKATVTPEGSSASFFLRVRVK